MSKSGEILRDIIMNMSQQMIYINVESFKKNFKRFAVEAWVNQRLHTLKLQSENNRAITKEPLPDAETDGTSNNYFTTWYRASGGLKTSGVHLPEQQEDSMFLETKSKRTLSVGL